MPAIGSGAALAAPERTTGLEAMMRESTRRTTRLEAAWKIRLAVTLGACLLAAAAAAACSGGGDTTGSGGASSSGGLHGGTGGQGADFTGAGGSNLGSGGNQGGMNGCAAETHAGKQDPLDLVIMLDQSGSMDGTVNNITVWQLVTDALDAFVQAPDSAGLGVGLQYFPLPDGPCVTCNNSCPSLVCVNNCCATATGQSCNNNNQACPGGGLCVSGQCYTSGGMATCNAADYAQLDVPVTVLPAGAGAVSTSLQGHSPGGMTPTGPALSGAIEAATSWAGANPSHIVAVVLATDGVPTECAPQDIGQIANIAAAASSGNPQVLTFVIGIGDLTALNSIAAAGGTQQAFIVTPNGNTTQQFIDALNAIRGQLLSCEFDIPQPDEGELDFGLVNVQFTPEGGSPEMIGKVSDASACDPNAGGWYYDDPANPTKIVMCPKSCDLLKSGAAAIDIVLGCKTIVR